MNWAIKRFNGYCTIDLPGNIFQTDLIDELKALLLELSDNDYNVFFLNMSQITKVNAKNLALIINIYKFASSYNIEVKLYNLHPYVSQLIFHTRLNQVFEICNPDIEFISTNPTNPHQKEYLSQACHSSSQ